VLLKLRNVSSRPTGERAVHIHYPFLSFHVSRQKAKDETFEELSQPGLSLHKWDCKVSTLAFLPLTWFTSSFKFVLESGLGIQAAVAFCEI
jgi:hypothetical protein